MVGMSTIHPLIVEVTHQDGIWTAECDALGLVTEASDYDALIERARTIAPELAALNGLALDPDALRLSFQYLDRVPRRRAQ